MKSILELENISTQIKRDIVRMVHGVQSGHPGGSLGCTEYLTVLYFYMMEHDTNFNMDGKNEDLFFLSNGHVSPLFYSVLARAGYFETKELSTFRKLNTRLQGHPTTHEGLPGVRMSSGSLGQGMSVAIGAALAKKSNKDTKIVYSLHGDGELQEGQNWEAIMFAAHHKVDNLIAAIDYNGQQIDGSTEKVMSLGDLKSKFLAFGWNVIDVEKGNDIKSIIDGLELAKKEIGKQKPICILLKTKMGSGVDFMEGGHEWHGIAPNDEQLANALSQLPETIGDY